MAKIVFDAIVVGSGISGGWAAKELTEKGLKVLMLERGKNIEHIKDYVNANKEPWEFPHRGRKTLQMIKDFPVLNRDYPLGEVTFGMWTNEKESPYTEAKRFDWYRGYHVGGRSLLWGRQSYRFNKWDFEANAKEGIAIDWPIRYDELAPWYSYVEKFAGIQGSKQGLDVLPDGEFMPAMQMNVAENFVADNLKKHFNGTRHMFIGRSANLTAPHHDRAACLYRNRCWRGCPYGAYFSTQSATLPAAMKTGNLTLKVYKIVTRILYDKDKKRATGVEVKDALTNKTEVYQCKVVFLCASAFNSTWVLMNSATDIWPLGLGSSSGELGHNVMDHHFRLGAQGRIEEFKDKYVYGRRPSGIYIPRFRNIYDDKRDYLRGFGYQGGASRRRQSGGQLGIQPAEAMVGVSFKEMLTEPGDWGISLGGFGEMLPNHNNKISLDKDKKDKWGLPVLAMDVELGENEKKMRVDMMNDAAEMLTAAGVKDVNARDTGYAQADFLGRTTEDAIAGHDPATAWLRGFAATLNVATSAPEPILLGRHLLELKVLPGPKMGELLKEAFEAQLDGQFTDLDSAKLWLTNRIEVGSGRLPG